MEELLKYLNGEEYSYQKCYSFLINEGKNIIPSDSSNLLQLINEHYNNTRNDFISFVNSIFYERIITNNDGILTQINDDDINVVKPLIYLPYKGIYTKSKNYNIILDYLIYAYIIKDDLLFSNDNSFVKLSRFMLKGTVLDDYSSNTKKYLNDENYFDSVIEKVKDYVHVKRLDVKNFYENYHVTGVNKPGKTALIGKKGEILFYKLLKKQIDLINDKYNLNIQLYFVSQDVNDSLNYDILIYIPETGEAHAFEVKTTTTENQFNRIGLSSREYNKYLKGMNIRKGGSLYKRFTSYNIVRQYIDGNNIKKICLLTKDNNYFDYISDLIQESNIVIECDDDNLLFSSYIDKNNGSFSISNDKYELTESHKNALKRSMLDVLFNNISNYSQKVELSNNQVIDEKVMKKILK